MTKNRGSPAVRTEDSGGPIVRETVCKTILNRTSICDYSLNCYTGCEHGCIYCYARFMQRFHPHEESWGKFVDVKVNAVEVLKRQLRRAEPGEVFVSSACDAWQPVEADRRLTRRCCELLLEYGFQVRALTKSTLVLRDIEVFAGHDVRVGTTITTLDEGLRALWEPRVASIDERFRVVEEAARAGLKTSIMFGPLLPFLSDSRESVDSLLQRAGDVGVGTIWVDALNPRPRVWPAVSQLLRVRFPNLHDRYRRILFARQERAKYLGELAGRVDRAAARLSLADRVTVCF